MEVLDRALFRHVSGAGSTEPVQKPISSTIKDGVQVDKFDLGNGGIAIVTCTGVTVSLSLGLQGKKLIDLNGGFGTTVTSCKITTIDKDGKIIDQKNADASDVDKGDVQIAENGTVEDSGDGLTQQAAGRLFEPFVSTKASGMGLGLVLSRSIVEAHGGSLWAEVADHGIFRFILPALDSGE